jgi:hypothetical protein
LIWSALFVSFLEQQGENNMAPPPVLPPPPKWSLSAGEQATRVEDGNEEQEAVAETETAEHLGARLNSAVTAAGLKDIDRMVDDSNDDENAAGRRRVGGVCESAYLGNENSKKLLLAMSYGLKVGDRILGDVSVEPFKSSKSKITFTPNANFLSDEVQRRADQLQLTGRDKPRCGNWNIKKLREWLCKYPITEEVDVLFLKDEEGNFKQSLELAQVERQVLAARTRAPSTSWIGPKPFLRLYHALIDDTVKVAFLERYNTKDREVSTFI